MCNPPQSNQPGYDRMILSPAVARAGTGLPNPERQMLARLDATTVFMMGDNPALPKMPEKPRLLDFFHHRFVGEDLTKRHLLTSAKRAMEDDRSDAVVLACLLHDFANGGLIRTDHGYWGAQMMRPYVSDETAFAIEKHQALRYVADPGYGYDYPDSYNRFFGPDYVPPAYIRDEAERARAHPHYAAARLVTCYDIYFFDSEDDIDPEIFAPVIERAFRQPVEGLGFDGSPSAHMWRTFIWPNNFL